jgi:hypothetical protein
VCGLPVGREADCAGCGWTLRSPRRPGLLTAGLRQDFSRRLTAAQHQFDVQVAARVSADRLAFPQLRGGPATAAEWTAATAAANRDREGAADEQQLRDIVTTVLLGLGTSRAAACGRAAGAAGGGCQIAEIGPDGVTLIRASLDEFGTPQLRTDPGSASWADLLPMLSAEVGQLRFQLAGGLAGVDRAGLSAAISRVVPGLTGW